MYRWAVAAALTVRMSDKRTKLIVGVVLADVVVAVVLFALLSPSKSVTLPAAKNMSPDLPNVPCARTTPSEDETTLAGQPWEPSPRGGVETEKDFFGEIRDWARKDPEAALAWAKGRPDSDDARKEALTDACFQIAQSDPVRAITLAEQYRLNFNSVLENLGEQWAAKDLNSAREWIAAQADSDERNALAVGMTFVWAQTQPAAAAEFVSDQMHPGSVQDQAMMAVLHQWALTDLAGASAWVQEFPDGPKRDRALNELSAAAQNKEGNAP